MMKDYLAHFGILGMKWGVRRFQDKNGTLTPKGKKRYGGDKDGKKEKRKGLTGKQKAIITTAAAVTATAATALILKKMGGVKVKNLKTAPDIIYLTESMIRNNQAMLNKAINRSRTAYYM